MRGTNNGKAEMKRSIAVMEYWSVAVEHSNVLRFQHPITPIGILLHLIAPNCSNLHQSIYQHSNTPTLQRSTF